MSRLILRTRTLRPNFRPLPSTARLFSSTFDQAPAPPRLPAEQQAEFERLQREAEARLSTHTAVPAEPSSPLQTSRHTTTPTPTPSSPPPAASSSQPKPTAQAAQGVEEVVLASADGEATFSGGIRKGAPPEFEGEVNPKTGEVGGPKNEPLRWGGKGDWSYNGRVTDF
ncbi:hypothetical protein GE09DRAFT_1150070 [Coniochaeta sp. 2T2.1]|nr:hypothetical protein GE09DRAFT_1150070 [Coniochaeta sp. 2T2.1]